MFLEGEAQLIRALSQSQNGFKVIINQTQRQQPATVRMEWSWSQRDLSHEHGYLQWHLPKWRPAVERRFCKGTRQHVKERKGRKLGIDTLPPLWWQRNPTVQVTCQLFHRIIGYFSCMHSQSDHFGRHRASHTGLGGHGQKLDMGPLGWGQEACWILMLIGALLLWWQLPQSSYLQHPLEMTPDVVLCTPPLPRETLQTWMLPTTWHSNALHTPLIQNAWWWLGRSSWGGTGRLSPFWIILPCEI